MELFLVHEGTVTRCISLAGSNFYVFSTKISINIYAVRSLQTSDAICSSGTMSRKQ
mgnify:FL=1